MTRLYYALAALSFVAGALLWLGGPPFWWFGAGFNIAGIVVAAWTGRDRLAELVDRARTPRETWGIEWVPARVFAEAAAIFVLAGVTAVMLPRAVLGDRVVAHDHTVHYFKAWQLAHEFLAEGHVYGWSQEWFAGYPAQYLYPIGADLLVTGIYVATLGLIDFSTAYAWAICLFWFVGGYAVYRFGVGAIGRWGALLAAFLFMTDTAANRIGGWYFAIEWGVWPMSLATVLAVWAMAKVPPLMEKRRWRDLGAFGLLMGAALISHPFMLIHLALALTVALVAYWLAHTERHWVVGATRLVAASVTGTLVGMLWLLPFFESRSFMDSAFGGRWTTMHELGQSFYQLDFLPGTWGMAIALGIVGMVAMLWSRRFERLLCGLMCLVFIVFGTGDFLTSFHFLEYFPSFQRVHFKRMITLLKPYWMVAAAYGLVAIVRHTSTHAVSLLHGEPSDEASARSQAMYKRWVRTGLVVVLLAPIAIPFGNAFGSKNLVRGVETETERPHRMARRKLVDWFEREYPDGEPFFRIGMKLGQHDHRFVDMGAELDFPIYKMGYMPATAFRHRFEAEDPELLRALNVRYVVSLGGAPAGDWERVERFGALNLYEARDWRREPFEIIGGGGDVEVREFSDERIVLEAGSEAEGRLRLNVSHFSRWHATRDGEPVDIETTSLESVPETAFMTVPLEPGTYRFEFRRGWTETLAWLFGLLGLLMAAAWMVADLDRRWTRRLRGRLEDGQKAIRRFTARRRHVLDWLGIAGVSLGIAAGLAMAWWAPPLRSVDNASPRQVEEVHYDFGSKLSEANVRVLEDSGGFDPCRQILGYFACGKESWKAVHQRVEDFGFEDSMARCIWAHPLPAGPIEIVFDDIPSGEVIGGYLGVAESGTSNSRNPVEFDVGINGVVRFERAAEQDSELSSFEFAVPEEARGGPMRVSFRVSAEDTGRRHFCFNAQVVDREE